MSSVFVELDFQRKMGFLTQKEFDEKWEKLKTNNYIIV